MLDYNDLPRDCWVEIDTARLADNTRLLQSIATTPVLVVVKANGYGHGLVIAARAFLKGGAAYLGVAALSEAMQLRDAGIQAPILIIGGMLPDDMAMAAAAGFEFIVYNTGHLAVLRSIISSGAAARVHIKVDTGMGRLGCFPHEAAAFGEALAAITGVEIVGLCTHFAMSDSKENTFTDVQIDRFDDAVRSLAEKNIRPALIHAAKSSGVLYYPRARYTMARLGIVAYGIPPSRDREAPEALKPALTWKARIVATKILPQGSTVSYGGEYTLPHDARVGVLPVGYADGFRRMPKNANKVLIDGQERAVLGRVNMDHCMVDLDGMPDMTGAEVMLLGQQGDKTITVRDLAARWDTNAHDTFTGIAARVPRRAV